MSFKLSRPAACWLHNINVSLIKMATMLDFASYSQKALFFVILCSSAGECDIIMTSSGQSLLTSRDCPWHLAPLLITLLTLTPALTPQSSPGHRDSLPVVTRPSWLPMERWPALSSRMVPWSMTMRPGVRTWGAGKAVIAAGDNQCLVSP